MNMKKNNKVSYWKTIKDVEINGYCFNLTFTDNSKINYEASDGGYSCWGMKEAKGVAKMTNGEKYKTVEERKREFSNFCSTHICTSCRCNMDVINQQKENFKCAFRWLELEYKAELKPCPFCGQSDIRMLKNSAGDVWYVHCNGCGCRTGGAVLKDMAIEAWNKRVND